MRTVYSRDVKKAALNDYANGVPVDVIHSKYGVLYNTLICWTRKEKVHRPKWFVSAARSKGGKLSALSKKARSGSPMVKVTSGRIKLLREIQEALETGKPFKMTKHRLKVFNNLLLAQVSSNR